MLWAELRLATGSPDTATAKLPIDCGGTTIVPASNEFSGGPLPARPIAPRLGETIVEWPHCPACGEARSTQCPACDTVGAAWEQAFAASTPEQHSAEQCAAEQYAAVRQTPYVAAVICPTCDEVFRPKLARRCTTCDHDFAQDDNADAASAGDVSAGHLSDESTSRASRRDAGQTARMIFAVIAAVGVIYTLYDWLMHNSGGSRLF